VESVLIVDLLQEVVKARPRLRQVLIIKQVDLLVLEGLLRIVQMFLTPAAVNMALTSVSGEASLSAGALELTLVTHEAKLKAISSPGADKLCSVRSS